MAWQSAVHGAKRNDQRRFHCHLQPVELGLDLPGQVSSASFFENGTEYSLGITISNAQVGFDLVTGGLDNDHQTVGGVSLIDVVISNTPIGIRSSTASDGSLKGSLVLNNVKLNNVPTAITVTDGTTVLDGTSGSSTIKAWGQGNVYSGTNGQGKFVQDNISAATKDASLLDSAGRIFGRGHPQYADYSVSQFASARDAGAKGDGVTDDTAALQKLLNDNKDCKVVFLDAGVYYITDTRMCSPCSLSRCTYPIRSQDSCRHTSRRRRMERPYWRRRCFQRSEEPQSSLPSWRVRRQGRRRDHRCHVRPSPL
jgi:hypothetical protein